VRRPAQDVVGVVTQWPPAERGDHVVLAMTVVDGDVVGIVPMAVDLDEDAQVGPREIEDGHDAAADLDRHLPLRRRDIDAAKELDELGLADGTGRPGAGWAQREDAVDAALSPASIGLGKLVQADQSLAQRRLEGPLEADVIEDDGKVDDGG
jgi:hypothetical protein